MKASNSLMVRKRIIEIIFTVLMIVSLLLGFVFVFKVNVSNRKNQVLSDLNESENWEKESETEEHQFGELISARLLPKLGLDERNYLSKVRGRDANHKTTMVHYGTFTGAAAATKTIDFYTLTMTGTNVNTLKLNSSTVANNGSVVVLGTVPHDITGTVDTGYVFDKWSTTTGTATYGNANTISTTTTVSAQSTINANANPDPNNKVTLTLKLDGSNSTALSGYTVNINTSSSSSTATWTGTTTNSSTLVITGAMKLGTTYHIWVGKDANHKTTMAHYGTFTGAVSATATVNFYTLTMTGTNMNTLKLNSSTVANNGSVVVLGGVKQAITGTATSGYTFDNWNTTSGTATYDNANTLSTNVTVSAKSTIKATAVVSSSNKVTLTLRKDGTANATDLSGYTVNINTSTSSSTATWTGTTTTSSTLVITGAMVPGTTYHIWVGRDANHKTTMVHYGTFTGAAAATKTIDFYTLTMTGTNVSSLKLNGSSVANNGSVIVLGSVKQAITGTVNTGYSFDNWSTTSGTATYDNANTLSTNVTVSAKSTIKATASIITYSISYTLNSGTVSPANPTTYNVTTATFTLNNPTKVGYTFTGWTGSNGTTPQTTVTIAKGSTGNKNYTANFSAITTTPYTVNHWQQKLTGNASQHNSTNYTLVDPESLQGTTDTQVTPAVKSYTGFTAPSTQTVTINGNGNTVVNYYYTRNSYSVTLSKGTGIATVTATGTVSGTNASKYLYEEPVTITATLSTGYSWNKWTGDKPSNSQTYTFNMGAAAVTNTANATINKVTIQIHMNGGSLAAAHGDTISDDGTYVLLNSSRTIHTINYGASLGTNGLADLTNTTYINLEKAGYHITPSEAFNTKADGTGTTFSQTTAYAASDFADVSTESKTVVLYANWKSNDATITIKEGTTNATTTGYSISLSTSSTTDTATKTTTNSAATVTFTTLTNGTYYIWAGKSSYNSTTKAARAYTGVSITVNKNNPTATITYYQLTKTQGANTTLTVKLDSSSGTAIATSYVLKGVTVYGSVTPASGYTATMTVGGSEFTSGNTFTMSAATTVASTATGITYKIYFYKGNGTSTAGTTLIGSIDAVYGSTVTLPTYANLGGTAPSGWTIYGWSSTIGGTTRARSNGASFTYSVVGDTNLYALFYKYHYFHSGEAPVQRPTGTPKRQIQYWNPYSTAATYLTSITIPAADDINSNTSEGWEFVGYRDDNNANGTVRYTAAQVGTTVKPAYNVSGTQRAKYSRTFTMKFNANGGTGTINNLTTKQFYNSGYGNSGGTANTGATLGTISFILPTSGYTKAGYTLKKWADGSTSGTQYDAGSTYTAWTPAIHDTTLEKTMYAIWVDETPPDVSVERVDYNTYRWTATDGVGVVKYQITNNSTVPTTWNSINSTTSVTNTAEIDGTTAKEYYVWAKDAAGNTSVVTANSHTISYMVTRDVGAGTQLTTNGDGTTASNGTPLTTSQPVLTGTPVWASASALSGYTGLTLTKNGTAVNAAGASHTITAATTFKSTASISSSNKVTLTLRYNGTASTALSGYTVNINTSSSSSTATWTGTTTNSSTLVITGAMVPGTTYHIWVGKDANHKSDMTHYGTFTGAAAATAIIDFYPVTMTGTNVGSLKLNGSPVTNGGSVVVVKGAVEPITGTVESGYTFTGWTASPTTGATIASASTLSTNATIKGAVTLNAAASVSSTNKVTLTLRLNGAASTALDGYTVNINTSSSSSTATWSNTTGAQTTLAITGAMVPGTTYHIWVGRDANHKSTMVHYGTFTGAAAATKTIDFYTLTMTGTNMSTLKLNGSTVANNGSVVVLGGVKQAITGTASSGYTFNKWTKESGTATFDSDTTLSTNVTVSAQSTIKATAVVSSSNKVTITLRKDGQASPDLSGYTVNISTSSSTNSASWTGTTTAATTLQITGAMVPGTTYYIWIGRDSNHKSTLVYAKSFTGGAAATATIDFYTLTMTGTYVSTLKLNSSNVANNGSVVVLGGIAHPITGIVNAGYTFNTWRKKSGTVSFGSATTLGTNVTVSAKSTIDAYATDVTKPVVTVSREDYNTYRWTATDTVGVVGYKITNSSTAPTSWNDVDSATSVTNTAEIDGTTAKEYYVWAKDAAGNVSAVTTNSHTISYMVTRNVGTGTQLNTIADGVNGTSLTTNQPVLTGTPVWVSAVANVGYSGVSLTKNNVSVEATGAEHSITLATTFASSATQNVITVNLKENNKNYTNSGMKVSLYQDGEEKYSTTCSTSSQAVFTGVASGKYDVYSGVNSLEKTRVVDTGIDVEVGVVSAQ